MSATPKGRSDSDDEEAHPREPQGRQQVSLFSRLASYLIRRADKRPPDFIIGRGRIGRGCEESAPSK